MLKYHGGWIAARPSDRKKLEELGIEIGYYDPDHGCFDGCSATEESIAKLKPFEGKLYWFFPKSGATKIASG